MYYRHAYMYIHIDVLVHILAVVSGCGGAVLQQWEGTAVASSNYFLWAAPLLMVPPSSPVTFAVPVAPWPSMGT